MFGTFWDMVGGTLVGHLWDIGGTFVLWPGLDLAWTWLGPGLDLPWTCFGPGFVLALTLFMKKPSKMCWKSLKMEALRVAFSMIFWVFVKSGNQRLDCACAVRLGFGPLVSTLWASIGALCFFNVFLTCFGVIPGSQKVPKNKVSLKWVSSESQVSLKWASSEPRAKPK